MGPREFWNQTIGPIVNPVVDRARHGIDAVIGQDFSATDVPAASELTSEIMPLPGTRPEASEWGEAIGGQDWLAGLNQASASGSETSTEMAYPHRIIREHGFLEPVMDPPQPYLRPGYVPQRPHLPYVVSDKMIGQD